MSSSDHGGWSPAHKVKVVYLGRKRLQEGWRRMHVVAMNAGRSKIQGCGLGHRGPIPAQGRKAAVEHHSIGHAGDALAWITVPEMDLLKTVSDFFIW